MDTGNQQRLSIYSYLVIKMLIFRDAAVDSHKKADGKASGLICSEAYHIQVANNFKIVPSG